MTGDELLALAERGLAHAEGDALVTAIAERSLFSRFARSHPTQATGVDEVDVRVLCVRNGHTGLARTNRTDDDSLRSAARRAGDTAAIAAREGPGDYPGLPAPADGQPAHDGFDADTARLDAALPGATLATIFAAAAERGLEAAGLWTAGTVRTAVASTAGARGTDAATDAYLKVVCRDDRGRSGFAAQAATAVAALDPGAVSDRAAAKVVPGEPAELPPGEYPAVLDTDAVGTLLEFLGWLAFNGLAVAEERSALTGRLGELVAAPTINLADSPRFPGTLPRAFDAEGVPKAPLPLIQDGVAHRVVHDTRSAAIAGGGARSTGHAIAPGGAPEGPLPRNLVLAGGGAADIDELVAPIERGIYITRLWYVNTVHAKQMLLTGMTRDGTFLIEDGRITQPLRDVRITDSVLRLLRATEALAARPQLVCEGEFYGRRFAHGVVCPAIRVRGLRLSAATI